MPELPEVEVYRRYIERHALGRTISSTDVLDRRALGGFSAATLKRGLAGRELHSVRRHGKHLFADARRGKEEVWLHIHFGMSGDVFFSKRAAETESRFPRVVFNFDDGSSLSFDDPRIFGRVNLVDSPDDFIRHKRLGPDALDPRLTRRLFADVLSGRKGAVKALLMKQEIVCGIGNLYADEMLFQAGIDPRRDVKKLGKSELGALFGVMRPILRKAIAWNERGSSAPGNFLMSNRDTDAVCPRCGGDIRSTVVGGRTTYYCAKHQK